MNYNTIGEQLTHVVPGSPAHQQGFRVGDYIVAVDGKPINLEYSLDDRASQYTRRASSTPTVVQCTVRRGSRILVIPMILETLEIDQPTTPPGVRLTSGTVGWPRLKGKVANGKAPAHRQPHRQSAQPPWPASSALPAGVGGG